MMNPRSDTRKECPKCGYVRTSDDLAPEGTCPRCGIIYSKFEEHARPEYHPDPSGTGTPDKKSRLGFGLNTVTAVIVFCCLAGVAYLYQHWQPRAGTVPVDNIHLETIQNTRVVLLSTDWCGYCKLAKTFLDRNRIQYVELNIEKTQEGMRLYKQMNGNGVPIVLVGDTTIRGFSEELMIRALRKEKLL